MTTEISAETLSPIVHNQIPVITTELLAKLYGTEVANLKMNFSRNAERFVQGKHFFKLEGSELRDFKHRVALNYSVSDEVTESYPVKIARNVRSLILWTERGAARHAKMLETDQAWEVFEKLEDCYFSLRPQLPVRDTSLISTRKEQRFILTLSDAGAKIQPVDENTFIGRVDQILSELRKSGWIVIKRDLLAEVLGTM
ncbi:ORF6N domain-containing protein [Cronobacter dublinensis]|uniref:ORF6N domain-containing protein n=1 Tax=Cronobacter dublinensis TaxID=413497 RepID=UPI0024C37933|nr:ORF6N domain-containing protein [Cronobacter dublinensis]MDK1192383.1 ORF6N domain-containing protein [Cronobacter dublinensis]MDK1203369.1 ORF6N domain-containing protein [Cronobacter dublinensis]